MTTTIAATITVTTCACSIIITSVLMIGTAFGGNLKEKVYRWFFLALLFNTIGAFCEATSAVLIGTSGEAISILFRIVDFFSYTFGYLAGGAFALYVYEYLSLKKPVKKSPFIFMMLCLFANIVLLAVGHITARYSLLDASNDYDPQGLTALAQILPALMLLTLMIVTLQNIKILKPREWVSLLFYGATPILCYGIENVFMEYPLWITYFGSAVVLLLLYVNIQVELKYALSKKETELMESRITVMLTQIQPHFIHNALLAIQDLCARDAKEAEVAVMEFSKYLRGNLESLTNNRPIYFEKELEHLRRYLSLEQRRFEERLQVEFDIQANSFQLPALSLQPIVENAVLHGVTQRVEGGKVIVRSREDATHWRITVEDTGVGFDTARPKEDEQSHIGIQNVRYRLETMCGGTLDIQSTQGIGTTAVISIPKEGNDI